MKENKALFLLFILTLQLLVIINPPTKKERTIKKEVKKSVN
jgi:hypothetical protein